MEIHKQKTKQRLCFQKQSRNFFTSTEKQQSLILPSLPALCFSYHLVYSKNSESIGPGLLQNLFIYKRYKIQIENHGCSNQNGPKISVDIFRFQEMYPYFTDINFKMFLFLARFLGRFRVRLD